MVWVLVSSSFHFAVHAIFNGDQFREAVICCWSSLCQACQLHPVRWAPIRLNNYWKNVSASTGRLAIMSCKLGEKSLLPHWYRQHQGAQTFTAVTGLGKQPDSDVYVFGPNLYFSSNGDLIAENQRLFVWVKEIADRIGFRYQEIAPFPACRWSLWWTPQCVEDSWASHWYRKCIQWYTVTRWAWTVSTLMDTYLLKSL